MSLFSKKGKKAKEAEAEVADISEDSGESSTSDTPSEKPVAALDAKKAKKAEEEEPEEIPELNAKDYKNLRNNKYAESQDKHPDVYILRHKSGKVAELHAISEVHACSLIGWRPRQVTLLQKIEGKKMTYLVKVNSKPVAAIEVKRTSDSEEIKKEILKAKVVEDRIGGREVKSVIIRGMEAHIRAPGHPNKKKQEAA
jgi:hypothetical protein